MSRFFIFILFISVIGLYGCKTTRSVIKEPLKDEGADFLIERLDNSELKFDYFSAKFHAEYVTDKNNTGFKGQIRIKKDSVIWISLSPALGIEAVRLMITTDSVFYIHRIEKVYFKGDYELVNKFLETRIDFDILQSFIIGNDFQFYETATFRASIDSREYKLSTTGRGKLKKSYEDDDKKMVLIQNIWLDPVTFKISRVDLKEYGKENKKLEAKYGNFIELEDQLFPSQITFDVTGDNDIYLDINYSKIVLNKALSFPFTIPGKYTRVK